MTTHECARVEVDKTTDSTLLTTGLISLSCALHMALIVVREEAGPTILLRQDSNDFLLFYAARH